MSLAPPHIYTGAEWGATAVSAVFPTKPVVGIVTHHTTSPNVVPLTDPIRERERSFALARAIQRDHMTRKPKPYQDSGQHFLLTRSGLILEGRKGSLAAAKRGRCVYGAHAGKAEINSQWSGVEWEGNQEFSFQVTDLQWEAGVMLYAWLAFWGAFDTRCVEPHRFFKPTQCPGHLADHLTDLRREAHDLKVKLLAAHA